jgi:UDP-4-amino-4-deoxy-L-arabinose-oxoglutarate aminotransferase
VTVDDVRRVRTASTKAAIVPHMYGVFADVASFRTLGVAIVEDCAQAVGARRAHPIVGDIAVFSFHPTKCLTTGEGGMVISRDATAVQGMRQRRDGTGTSKRLFAPLSDAAAALGLSQLSRYEDGLRRRAEIAARYTDVLASSGVRVRTPARPTMHYRYPLGVRGGLEAVADAFASDGVAVRRGVDRLLHRLAGHPDSDFPAASTHFANTVMLPIYPALTDQEHRRCCEAARRILGVAMTAPS